MRCCYAMPSHAVLAKHDVIIVVFINSAPIGCYIQLAYTMLQLRLRAIEYGFLSVDRCHA